MRGLGDLVAKATSAVGVKPCGGCQKRQEALNRLVPFPHLPLPEGYRLRLQGQRDADTQILLAEGERWGTFEYAGGAVSSPHLFDSEAESRADFNSRMEG